MAAIALPYPNELTFRPFQPWLWLDCAGLALCDLGCVALALLAHEPRYLILIVPISLCILLLIIRHYAHTITINGSSLICRRGLLRVRETTIPIARLDFEIRQTFMGRIFDYGTVRVAAPTGLIEVRRIASIRMLRAMIAERQTELYFAPMGWLPRDRR